MNNQEYWENRAIVKDKLLEKDINKTEKKLLKLFENVKEELLKELRVIYSDPQVFTPYQISHIDELLESVYKAIDNLYKKNEKQVTEALVDTYKTMYNEASVDLKASFNTVNEDLIREVVKTNWSGLTFSDRIWEHRGKLKVTLKEELSKGLIRGDSLQDISRLMTDRLNNSYSNAIRLVRTESCWIMNEATVNNYKDNDIKEYEFMAFLDKKTSPQCRKLDGERLYIDEARAGLNLPPLHPNCRSCIIPVVEDITIKKRHISESKNDYYAGYEGFDVDKIPAPLNRSDYKHLDNGREIYRAKRKEREDVLEKIKEEGIERAINRPRKYNNIERATSKLKELGFKEVHLDNVDPLLYDDIITSYEYSLNKIPLLKNSMHYLGDNTGLEKLYKNKEFKEISIKNIMEMTGKNEVQAKRYYSTVTKKDLLTAINEEYLSANYGMMMNNKIFKDYKNVLSGHFDNLADNFLFKSDGTIQSVFTHEIGHNVDKMLRIEYGVNFDDFLTTNSKILEAELSEYGTLNSHEAFAELYSNYIHCPQEKQNTLTVNFGKWLEEKLKEVK